MKRSRKDRVPQNKEMGLKDHISGILIRYYSVGMYDDSSASEKENGSQH